MTPRHYSARLVKNGPIVGVRLFFGPPIIDGEVQDRSPRLNVVVDTELTSRFVWQLAAGGEPVDVEGCTLRIIAEIEAPEYHYLVSHAGWAQDWSPQHPAATPRKSINLQAMKGLF